MGNRLIILESEKNKIRKMYGLLNEQSQLPTIVSGNYTASNCDELHAFQSTGGKVIGNMNVIVGSKLEEIYKFGINPKPVKVDVKVNGLTVNWSVTIDKSNDGKPWVGFTSRGAGCNNDVYNRAVSSSQGNDMGSAKQKIMSTYGESNIEIEEVNDFVYKDPKNGFRQVFYRYTKPKKYPSVGGGGQATNQNLSEKKLTVVGNSLEDLNQKTKTQLNSNSLLSGATWGFKSMSIGSQGSNVSLDVNLVPDKNGFKIFSILFNPKGSTPESKNNALNKNPDSKIVASDFVNYNGKDFQYHLIGIK